jgi:hypothetical protein
MTDDDLPDIMKEDPEKLKVYYSLLVLDLLADKVYKLRKERGVDFVYRLLHNAAIGELDEDTREVMKANFEDLLLGNEDEFKTINFEEFLASAETWDRVLLALGVSPRFRNVLELLFGDFGIISVIALIRTLSEGVILPFTFYQINRDLSSD